MLPAFFLLWNLWETSMLFSWRISLADIKTLKMTTSLDLLLVFVPLVIEHNVPAHGHCHNWRGAARIKALLCDVSKGTSNLPYPCRVVVIQFCLTEGVVHWWFVMLAGYLLEPAALAECCTCTALNAILAHCHFITRSLDAVPLCDSTYTGWSRGNTCFSYKNNFVYFEHEKVLI